ncbi:DUF2628 domain-containing protein [Rhizobium gallicum]|uniref:DUF2628 domain-containing protein n=1 Tax=Rhizobium gallicum TaxID=56730 RepID=UPI001EF79EE2|nr:DUF2628 domain-containing protein [Rhizobium gallicum]ULJ70624.1 hypothetical protein L2W42_11700 [Rhizobium gallicum]
MTRFINHHNGHKRAVGGFTAFLGSAFFGPLYFLIKGHWPAFLVIGFFNALLAILLFPYGIIGAILVNVIVSPFAGMMVRNYYLSRGFEMISADILP